MLSPRPFYEFVREERQFCAVLAHLLMQRGPNLERFLDLVDSRLDYSRSAKSSLEEAQVYIEFSYLRDHWNSLASNEDKRTLLFELLRRCELTDALARRGVPHGIPAFNALFMGARGLLVLQDIVYPGQWSVEALFSAFGSEANAFRDFCRFKWAFNIKPDIVILLPDRKPLCIEAKLESKEGQYPATNKERLIFDKAFAGKGLGRVNQVELQQFMFDRLLGTPCDSLVIGRRKGPEGAPFVSWKETLDELDFGASIEFANRLRSHNIHLRASTLASGLAPVKANPANIKSETFRSFAEDREDFRADEVTLDRAGLPLDAEHEEIPDPILKDVVAGEQSSNNQSA